jgi:3-dehydroquinate synthase
MIQRLTCQILQSSINYEIEIGDGLLFTQASFLRSLAARFAIISDETVGGLYGKPLQNSLLTSGLETHLFTFPRGEQSKTREMKEDLEDQLFEKRFTRDTCIIALGGGVVTDLTGYLAATYCRGVPLVMMPTSLLGMVDASLGGKTGVNVPYGKNMLGCIYQPRKVVIDLLTLKSLPKKELINGIVEIIKYGLISDAPLFEYLEDHLDSLLTFDLKALEQVILKSCQIKNEIVEQDEKDLKFRHLLNFGHTVGHALELLTNYALSHGEAVALGLIVESHFSLKLGILDEESFKRIKEILIRYGLPLKWPFEANPSAILQAMKLDKKSVKGQPRFVLIEKIGLAKTCISKSLSLENL